MAITDENKNKVITLEGLNHFYDRIKNAFLKKADADTYYAGINGDGNTEFNASTFTVSKARFKGTNNSTVEARYNTASPDNVTFEFQGVGVNEGRVKIPFTAGTITTVAMTSQLESGLKGKADVVAPNGNNLLLKYCVQPHVQVFNGKIGDEQVVANKRGNIYFYVKPLVSEETQNGLNETGFYYCLSGSMYVFICAPSPQVIYYNTVTASLCVWNGTGFSNIATGGSVTPPEGYETATDVDIDGIIDIINGTTTDSE